ncbi:hypothetical protein PTMSG1_02971 [Pyrenophora teres f. maculata]|nr:hypothetical protein PTMSG1_02971 [Pyrenophora teres f. maculata]
MHPAAITAWAAQPRKTRRLILAETLPNSHTKPVPSWHNRDSDVCKVIEKKRTRTPSPRKRQFPTDTYSPDADPVDELDEPTSRRPNTHNIQPIPKLSYRETLAAIADELDVDGDGDGLRPRLSLRSRTQSQSASTSSARSQTNTTALQRVQLGTVGFALLQTLEDVSDGPVFPARLQEQLSKVGIERIKPHQFDHNDNRPIEELLHELHIVQTINALSHRCAENRDHESEWNNRVHSKVLELALGNDEASIGFRSVTAARITPEFRPTHSPGLTTGKIVDYAMFLELSHSARDAILPLVGMSSKSINHVSYEGLRTRPIAVSIETKTESRTVEEAKVQLGVWLAAQVARIEELIQQVVLLKANKHGAEIEARTGNIRYGEKGRMYSRPQTQNPTPPPATDVVNPDPINLISQIVFPLLSVQSESWSLFFGRVSTPPDIPNSDIRKPASHIQIFHSIALGNTANTAQTYRLVKSLEVLKAWIDRDFRRWWDVILDVDGEGGEEKESEDRSN